MEAPSGSSAECFHHSAYGFRLYGLTDFEDIQGWFWKPSGSDGHFTKYSQAYLTKNQTAKMTAQILHNDFIMHYGFPARLHSDQGRILRAKSSRSCVSRGDTEERHHPLPPLGNGQCERFNRTLLEMLDTLETDQKVDWKMHVAPLVHIRNLWHPGTPMSLTPSSSLFQSLQPLNLLIILR